MSPSRNVTHLFLFLFYTGSLHNSFEYFLVGSISWDTFCNTQNPISPTQISNYSPNSWNHPPFEKLCSKPTSDKYFALIYFPCLALTWPQTFSPSRVDVAANIFPVLHWHGCKYFFLLTHAENTIDAIEKLLRNCCHFFFNRMNTHP